MKPRAFAAHGVFTASLIDITRRAGQRNRGALHYHFGSVRRCSARARTTSISSPPQRANCSRWREADASDNVESVVEAIVRPATELAESGWRGRCFLVILSELIEEDPAGLDPDVSDVLARTGDTRLCGLDHPPGRRQATMWLSSGLGHRLSSCARWPTAHGQQEAVGPAGVRSWSKKCSCRTWWRWSRRGCRPLV